MTTPVLFKFLDESCDTDTLLRIRREIEGETDAYYDESDSDEEDEDVTTRVRQTSPTVFALLKISNVTLATASVSPVPTQPKVFECFKLHNYEFSIWKNSLRS